MGSSMARRLGRRRSGTDVVFLAAAWTLVALAASSSFYPCRLVAAQSSNTTNVTMPEITLTPGTAPPTTLPPSPNVASQANLGMPPLAPLSGFVRTDALATTRAVTVGGWAVYGAGASVILINASQYLMGAPTATLPTRSWTSLLFTVVHTKTIRCIPLYVSSLDGNEPQTPHKEWPEKMPRTWAIRIRGSTEKTK